MRILYIRRRYSHSFFYDFVIILFIIICIKDKIINLLFDERNLR